jgi:hypothetical protein
MRVVCKIDDGKWIDIGKDKDSTRRAIYAFLEDDPEFGVVRQKLDD